MDFYVDRLVKEPDSRAFFTRYGDDSHRRREVGICETEGTALLNCYVAAVRCRPCADNALDEHAAAVFEKYPRKSKGKFDTFTPEGLIFANLSI